MGLDVYLTRKKYVSYDEFKTYTVEHEEIFSGGTTHNLTPMADEAGIYEALWRPYRLNPKFKVKEEDKITEFHFEVHNRCQAKDIIPYLEKGLKDLKERPDHYAQFNSDNGWGLYEDFVPFVEEYLEACKAHPESIIKTSR